MTVCQDATLKFGYIGPLTFPLLTDHPIPHLATMVAASSSLSYHASEGERSISWEPSSQISMCAMLTGTLSSKRSGRLMRFRPSSASHPKTHGQASSQKQ